VIDTLNKPFAKITLILQVNKVKSVKKFIELSPKKMVQDEEERQRDLLV